MEYPIDYIGPLPAMVAIYHGDGSVSVVHGGIESGQGMHTKVAQVAAATLRVPYQMIKVKRMDIVAGANAFGTGGSQTSEAVAYVSLSFILNFKLDLFNEHLPHRLLKKHAKNSWAASSHSEVQMMPSRHGRS